LAVYATVVHQAIHWGWPFRLLWNRVCSVLHPRERNSPIQRGMLGGIL
jgi:hypothetical protein